MPPAQESQITNNFGKYQENHLSPLALLAYRLLPFGTWHAPQNLFGKSRNFDRKKTLSEFILSIVMVHWVGTRTFRGNYDHKKRP